MKKVFQKIVSGVIMVSVLASLLCFPVMADENITVLLNGEELEFDVPPQMIEDRTMVPMRKIFESLGAEIEWDDATQTVTAAQGDAVVIMQIGNAVISVNGTEIELDVPPQLVDDRTLVPVRAVAESLNAQVEWDDATQTVIITKEESAAQSDTEQSPEIFAQPMGGYSYASALGHVTLLSADDGSWTIVIPEDYEPFMAIPGNHIFQKIDENDNLVSMYVQMRGVSNTDLSLQEIVEDAVQDRLSEEYGGANYSIAKEITETTVNGLDYYTFTINMSMKGNSIYYGTCYFTIWDDMLFEFTYMGPGETPPAEFQEILESFNPLGAQ